MKEFEDYEKELKDMSDVNIEEKDIRVQIEKQINRRIIRICLKTMAVVTAIAGLLFLGISPLMNQSYLNPQKLENNENQGFTKYLRAYYETMRPYAEVASLNIEKQGFANYTIALDVQDHIGKAYMGIPNVTMQMERGKMKMIDDSEGRVIMYIGRFESDWVKKDDFLKDMEELPDSSRIYISIGEANPKPVSRLRKEDVELEWIEVYNDVSKFQGGISLNLFSAYDDTDKRKDLTDIELKEVFLDNLDLLISQPILLQSFGVYSGNTFFHTLEPIMQTKETVAAQKELTTKNYCFSGKKQEVIEYLKKIDTVSIHVDEIKLSDW